MSGLSYVGLDPSTARDVENRINEENALAAGNSRSYVTGRAHTLAASYATKAYVDNQDATFESVVYYQNQDNLLVPNAYKGAPSGIASLDSGGKIPTAQIPVLGIGILRGPIPITTTVGGTTGATPIQIGQWQLGQLALTCQIWVFMAVSIVSTNGRPVVEVRAGTAAQSTYASQTLIAGGFGRTWFNDYQTIDVSPFDPNLSDANGSIQTPYGPNTNLNVTVYAYDGGGGSITTQAGLIVNASLYLVRTTL